MDERTHDQLDRQADLEVEIVFSNIEPNKLYRFLFFQKYTSTEFSKGNSSSYVKTREHVALCILLCGIF